MMLYYILNHIIILPHLNNRLNNVSSSSSHSSKKSYKLEIFPQVFRKSLKDNIPNTAMGELQQR